MSGDRGAFCPKRANLWPRANLWLRGVPSSSEADIAAILAGPEHHLRAVVKLAIRHDSGLRTQLAEALKMVAQRDGQAMMAPLLYPPVAQPQVPPAMPSLSPWGSSIYIATSGGSSSSVRISDTETSLSVSCSGSSSIAISYNTGNTVWPEVRKALPAAPAPQPKRKATAPAVAKPEKRARIVDQGVQQCLVCKKDYFERDNSGTACRWHSEAAEPEQAALNYWKKTIRKGAL
ncbi:hypothetical protein QBC34DRAFT_472916 [Podospora aff. communis PSN243]|uniref:Uncharacterized protein n=1 Tax=Podospora aff. communis PSN243 TaxID=3040156 RepID=A0AAV9GC91_9PEZI|nr:hypothetical protein QBC34DRAFT_472916 [Podospora aff. communis PSN243]